LGKRCKVYSLNKVIKGKLKMHVIYDNSDRNNIFKVIQIETEDENYDKYDRIIEIKLSDILKIEII
jgi:hypothetical protein